MSYFICPMLALLWDIQKLCVLTEFSDTVTGGVFVRIEQETNRITPFSPFIILVLCSYLQKYQSLNSTAASKHHCQEVKMYSLDHPMFVMIPLTQVGRHSDGADVVAMATTSVVVYIVFAI